MLLIEISGEIRITEYTGRAVLFLFGVVAVDIIAKDEAFIHDDAVQVRSHGFVLFTLRDPLLPSPPIPSLLVNQFLF